MVLVAAAFKGCHRLIPIVYFRRETRVTVLGVYPKSAVGYGAEEWVGIIMPYNSVYSSTSSF